MSTNFITPVATGDVLNLDVKSISAEHPEYKERKRALGDISLLYAGGYKIKACPERFLVKRPREQKDVYVERCRIMTYQNILKSALGYYESAMFRDPVSFLFRSNGGEMAQPGNDWYTAFGKNCNRGGTSLENFMREVLRDMLCYQRSFVLTDMKSFNPGDFRSLAEQKLSGQQDPFLVLFKAEDATNWDKDSAGNYNWIVFRTLEADREFGKSVTVYDKWYYYDKKTFKVYQAEHQDGDSNSEQKAVLVNQGAHALASYNRVPVRAIEVPDVLWLADGAYPQLVEHLNQDNTYGWGLKMANIPVPVIKGEFEQPPQIGETTYIQVATDGDFKFAETSGVSFGHSQIRLDTLREEIYRSFFLLAQGKSSSATASAQSGASKQADMMPSRDIMGGLAGILEEGIENVMRDVSDARDEQTVSCAVQGLEQEDEDVTGELANIQLANDLNIPSDTLEKILYKRAARKFFRGQTPEDEEKVIKEIDDAPTKSARAAQAQQQQASGFSAALQKGTDRFVAGAEVSELKEGL